ncbi:MAG: DegT/DnrJ/EryC1/StrS family aminotransferase [Humidesulfovibrio sp.]|uniref:DegT/DnrJ/EryC1/StrS family aminotransferase n=1 Tax=Humidesulfovibrio sp. TaxID=2910988 RepID=UPI0027FB6D5B|nr:DegT/DnrJ/EryC1/StrS family aminotransferase [Humidesulfovibrio sp.]MDQ7834244.1 DegT/DnrJ/EryC1/StrS family aminotransferase [Humidesulfovibrio sp.]
MKRVVPFGKPILGEAEQQAVLEVLGGPVLVHGPRVKQFEADFAAWTQSPHALAVGSCTAGLHLFWFDLEIGPGDEVIVPAQTHSATAHAVEYTGASCVFVDCEQSTGNIDVDALAAAVTPRTRGISLVHFLGLPADMDGINAVAKKHCLPVLEDCALSIGATYKGVHTGLLGDAGAFSFYPVKHMTTAEGGMFITQYEDLAARITKKRAFGVDRVVGERSVPGVYDVTMLGYNYRMNEIEAAIGIEQLKRMDGFLARRRENFAALSAGLAELPELTVLASGGDDEIKGSHYCLSVVLRESLRPLRFELVKALNALGVGTSVYYPRPVPHMSYYRNKYGHEEGSFPNAAAISYGSIALPVGPHLDLDDMAYMVDAMKQALSEVQ